ncbi:BnaA08g03810D [Brassica napus]|uniref:BnaA08g03810D protein n=1 Tax=Brassica napus TaxID=3708 RepID=A0A078FWD6_BRANA|nr:BnaA08g03810D [Brassica napus]
MASNDQAFEYAQVQATYVENVMNNAYNIRLLAPSHKMTLIPYHLYHPRQPMANEPPTPAHSARRLHPVRRVVRYFSGGSKFVVTDLAFTT